MPLFTVIIPTHNRRQVLLRALRAVYAQRCRDFEVVVVDDGSTDGTREALVEFGSELRCVHQTNLGPAAARNAGARLARGEYLAFLDSDDWWFPWTLELHAQLIAEHARPSWLYGRVWVDARDAEGALPSAPRSRFFPDYWHAAERDGITLNPSGVVLRTETFLRAGGFSEALRVGEDFDLWFRLAREPGFVLVDAPAMYVRTHHDAMLTLDFARAYAGLCEVSRRERSGHYAADARASALRRAFLSRQFAYYALESNAHSRRKAALKFYWQVLRMHIEDGFREPVFGRSRGRFLGSFLLFFGAPALHTALRRLRSPKLLKHP